MSSECRTLIVSSKQTIELANVETMANNTNSGIACENIQFSNKIQSSQQ